MPFGQLPWVVPLGIEKIDIRLAFHPEHEGDLLSVRGPGRRGIETRMREKTGLILPIEIDEVEIRVSFEIGSKGNPFSIRSPDRRDIDRLIPGDLSNIGSIDIGDKDFLISRLKVHVDQFGRVDSSLSRELKDDLVDHPVHNGSKILKGPFILFSHKVFLFHKIKEVKF